VFRSVFLDSWKKWNPHYQFVLHTNTDCEKFIQNNFEERVFRAYCNIGPNAFKTDLWRYCILYVYGGVYADIDTVCMCNIDDVIKDDMDFVIHIDLNNKPFDGEYNLFNSFIASAPGCELFLRTIYRIVDNVENSRKTLRMDFSGPGAIGQDMNLFLGLPETTSFIGREGIFIKKYDNEFDITGENKKFVISFLHFENNVEYVKDISSGTVLFQNKNGNHDWKYIYVCEIQNLTNFIPYC
jgi:Glycosyltransferase sugar-binding region containing DXD motif